MGFPDHFNRRRAALAAETERLEQQAPTPEILAAYEKNQSAWQQLLHEENHWALEQIDPDPM